MGKYRSKYSYLTDDEALSFIRTLAGELGKLAADRDFRLLMPSFAHAELTIRAMKRFQADTK